MEKDEGDHVNGIIKDASVFTTERSSGLSMGLVRGTENERSHKTNISEALIFLLLFYYCVNNFIVNMNVARPNRAEYIESKQYIIISVHFSIKHSAINII